MPEGFSSVPDELNRSELDRLTNLWTCTDEEGVEMYAAVLEIVCPRGAAAVHAVRPMCGACGGKGYNSNIGCCGHALPSGECCSNGIEVQDPCEDCGTTGFEPLPAIFSSNPDNHF